MDIARQELGAKIKEARTDKKISLRQLEELTGINRNTINAVEMGKGNPTINVYLALAKFFDLKVSITPA